MVESAAKPSLVRTLAACLLLVAACCLVFHPVTDFDFIHYDDFGYTLKNPLVSEGLSWRNAKEAFCSIHEIGFWIPLVWISFQADQSLFRGDPGGYHLTNALFHGANALLLFLVLLKLTRRFWPGLFVALLFAVQPQAVESVAWVTERKDVLSVFFWLLSLLAYSAYVKGRRWYWYGLVMAFFLLGLMAKSMVVTLPFVLLLLDYWPMKRLNLRSVLEKIPFFLVSLAAGLATLLISRQAGGVNSLEALSLSARLGTALTGYAGYLYKLVWPADLAVLYPIHRQGPPAWETLLAVCVLAVITGLCLRFARSRPYLLMGWLWYLGTLFPVSGLLQSGVQARADRFTYFPLIGLFIMLAWGLRDLAGPKKTGRLLAGILAAGICAAFLVVSAFQVRLWENTETLLTHTLAVTQNNWMARNILASALVEEGRHEEARGHLEKALAIEPGSFNARFGMGVLLAGQKDVKGALDHFDRALEIRPGSLRVLGEKGALLLKAGKTDQAARVFGEVLSGDPENAGAHYFLGTYYARANQPEKAVSHLEQAVELAPANAQARLNLGNAWALAGNQEKALEHYQKAAKLAPDHPGIRLNLGMALARKGRLEKARQEFEKVLELNPANTTARQYITEINKHLE